MSRLDDGALPEAYQWQISDITWELAPSIALINRFSPYYA